jgi:hypothetical protein
LERESGDWINSDISEVAGVMEKWSDGVLEN